MKMPAEWPPPTQEQIARRHAARQRKGRRESIIEDLRALAVGLAYFAIFVAWMYFLTFLVMLLGGGA